MMMNRKLLKKRNQMSFFWRVFITYFIRSHCMSNMLFNILMCVQSKGVFSDHMRRPFEGFVQNKINK